MLNLLLKQANFVPSNSDYEQFINACIDTKWERGLQVFLQSHNMSFIFTSLPIAQQKQVVKNLIGQDVLK